MLDRTTTGSGALGSTSTLAYDLLASTTANTFLSLRSPITRATPAPPTVCERTLSPLTSYAIVCGVLLFGS